MNILIIIIASALILAASIILYRALSWRTEDLFFATGCISGITVLFFLIIFICASITTPQAIYKFQTQKQYIESHTVEDPVENAALTNKKIELNDWLYTAQYRNANWGGWSFYPDSVQDLTPIE